MSSSRTTAAKIVGVASAFAGFTMAFAHLSFDWNSRWYSFANLLVIAVLLGSQIYLYRRMRMARR